MIERLREWLRRYEPFRTYGERGPLVRFLTPILVVALGVWMVRSGAGFPFPPHTPTEWGADLSYVVVGLLIVDYVLVIRSQEKA